MKAPNTAALTAASISASSRTTRGAFPPSSSPAGLMPARQFAGSSADLRRAGEIDPPDRRMGNQRFNNLGGVLWIVGEHIDDTFRRTRFRESVPYEPMRAEQIRRPSAPPYSARDRHGDGAGPWVTGAFHGAMPTHTPAGLRTASDIVFGLSEENDLAGDLRCHGGGFTQHTACQHYVKPGPGRSRSRFLDHQACELIHLARDDICHLKKKCPSFVQTRFRPIRGNRRPVLPRFLVLLSSSAGGWSARSAPDRRRPGQALLRRLFDPQTWSGADVPLEERARRHGVLRIVNPGGRGHLDSEPTQGGAGELVGDRA